MGFKIKRPYATEQKIKYTISIINEVINECLCEKR